MNNVKNMISKEEYKVIYNFLKSLNKWYDSENITYDNLTKKYYDRLIKNITGLISSYKKNEYIDVIYCLQLIRNNMYNLMEDYRKDNKRRYKSFKKIYDLLLDIENK